MKTARETVNPIGPNGVSEDRKRAPVFVVGSARSGTTLLYDMLLSAGGFALYLGESNVFNLLAPRVGDLRVPENRQRMLDVWLGSRLFKISGLDPCQIERLMPGCENAGDFLRRVMDEIARQHNACRWAGNAPEEILHLPLIKTTIPDALIVHVIRDGRDVGLSLAQKNYIRPFPWKGRETPEGAALYWKWIVEKGRAAGAKLGADYTEIRFEDLVANPRAVLRHLSRFLNHELDYSRIQKMAIGSVARPNTSFATADSFNPVERWRRQLSAVQLARMEGLIGSTLTDLGYKLATPGASARNRMNLMATRMVYRRFFELKLQAKMNPFLRRLRPKLTSKEVDRIVVVDDNATRQIPQLLSMAMEAVTVRTNS